MRNIFLITFLLSTITFSQEVVTTKGGQKVVLNDDKTWSFSNESEETVESGYFKESDFLKSSNSYNILNKKVWFKDGNDNLINGKIDVMVDISLFNSELIESLNNTINVALLQTKWNLKNKSTFTPKSILLSVSVGSNPWVAIVKYTAQNDYGAIKDGSTIVYFNHHGNFVKVISK